MPDTVRPYIDRVNYEGTEYDIYDTAHTTLTQAEITTGTDQTPKFITAKVFGDVISGLGGGTVTDVRVNGASVLDSEGVANISEDVVNITYTVISGTDHEMIISSVYAPNYAETLLSEAY